MLGEVSAPFLAIRTLHQLAEEEHKHFPLAAKVVKEDTYVDDVITGANTVEQTIEIRNQLQSLRSKGGFNIRQ